MDILDFERESEKTPREGMANKLKLTLELKIRGLVCFPSRRCRMADSLEVLAYCNVIEELDILCTPQQSFLLEELEPQIKSIVSRFTDCRQSVLRDDASYIDDEQERPRMIEWFKEVTYAAIDTKCIIDEFIVNKARQKIKKTSPFNKFLLLFFNDYATATRATINKLESIGNKITHLAEKEFPSTDQRAPSSSSHGQRHLGGRENDAKVIKQNLLMLADQEKGIQVISVVGMPGSGKTALTHQIYSHYSVVYKFDVFAWAHSGSSQGIHFLNDTWCEALQKLWAFKEDPRHKNSYMEMKRDLQNLKKWFLSKEIVLPDLTLLDILVTVLEKQLEMKEMPDEAVDDEAVDNMLLHILETHLEWQMEMKEMLDEAVDNTLLDFLDTDLERQMKMKRMLDEAVDKQNGNEINQYAISDLLANQRFLIIIDDVRTADAWDQVKQLLPMDSMNGSRILLTTRDTRVARHAIHDQVGSPPPHQLGPLSARESWQLFTIKVRPSPLPLDLESIGEEIVKKCDGLPFAIEHLAQHLLTKEKTYGVWLNVLESAHKQLHEYYQTPWSYITDMIVKDLPLKLKQCLFYFGLFPKNATIPTRRLIGLWVAEGFIEPRNNNINETPLEYIAEEYLQALVDLNMVQVTKQRSNGTPKRCCLANYLRQHLFTRAKQANSCASTCVSSTSRRSTTTVGVGRFADHPNENGTMDEYTHDSSRLLLSFLSFDYREGSEPGERIRNLLCRGIINKGCFQLLRVLDLEGVYKPELPKETGRLIHLTYLGLRWTYLETFPPFISRLINLQTLDVKHTYINTLPGFIWKLRKLRHLYLNGSHLDSFVHRPNADYLDNLQTLEGIFLDEESSVKEGLDRFTRLTRLGVSCHLTSISQQDAMAKWISTLEHLQSLKVRSMDRLGKLSALHLMDFTDHHTSLSQLYFLGRLEKLFQVNAFPPNLTELTLSASKLEKDPMPTLERLPNLSILRLHCDSYVGEIMTCFSFGFKKLQVLEIWKLETLKIWMVEEEAMQILKKLEIRSCNNLKMLPVGLQHITTIEELKLTDMPKKFTDEVKTKYMNSYDEWYKKAGVCFVYLNN